MWSKLWRANSFKITLIKSTQWQNELLRLDAFLLRTSNIALTSKTFEYSSCTLIQEIISSDVIHGGFSDHRKYTKNSFFWTTKHLFLVLTGSSLRYTLQHYESFRQTSGSETRQNPRSYSTNKTTTILSITCTATVWAVTGNTLHQEAGRVWLQWRAEFPILITHTCPLRPMGQQTMTVWELASFVRQSSEKKNTREVKDGKRQFFINPE